MEAKSTSACPIPAIDVPSFVFSSEDGRSETRLLLSADDLTASLSLREYKGLAKQFAHGLIGRDVKPGDRIMLASPNSIFNTVVFMGALMAECVFVGAQAAFDLEDFVLQLKQTEPRLLLFENSFRTKITELVERKAYPASQLFRFDGGLVDAADAAEPHAHWTSILSPATASDDWQWRRLTSDDELRRPVTLIYSSGTSGDPKGVELSHRQLVAAAVHSAYANRAAGRDTQAEGPPALQTPPLAYMSMSQVVGQLVTGVLFPFLKLPIYVASKLDLAAVQIYCIDLGLTSLVINPAFAVALMKNKDMLARVPEMHALQTLVFIGSPISEHLCETFVEFWKAKTGKRIAIRFAYGMTELTAGVIQWSQNIPESLDSLLFPNTELKIVQSRDIPWQDLAGKTGELWVRGPTVANGYWRNPLASELAFIDGWLRTGDIASISSQGDFSIIGRKKDLIHCSTGITSPYYLEQSLLTHPDVQGAVVCQVKVPQPGKDTLIRAYIIKCDGSILDEAGVREFMRKTVPSLPQLDGGVLFLDQIPKTLNHKPHRRKLVALPYFK